MINEGAINNSATINFVLNKNMITNCLTYIPQDINLELIAGVFTSKAGSKVYVPNGFEADGTTPKFDVVTIESDISLNSWGSATGEVLIGFDSSSSSFAWGNPSTAWYSGNTAPTLSGTSTTANWYDTANNIIKSTTNSGSSWDSSRGLSLPFALCTRTSGTLTSIDQVFNGFGYIGSICFILHGVKGLISNGRNADRSLKNIEFAFDKILVSDAFGAGSTNTRVFYNIDSNTIFRAYQYFEQTTAPNVANVSNPIAVWYNPEENIFRQLWKNAGINEWTIRKIVDIGVITTDSSNKVVSFTTKNPFHALDYNDSGTIVGWGAPNYGAGVSVSSGYTAPTDGVITVRASGNNRTSNVSINGVNVFNSNWDASYGTPDNAEYRVGAGQTITLSGVSCTFYPLLGV